MTLTSDDQVTVVAFGARPWVLGVLNVTSDSFSDGGRWVALPDALAQGRRLVADGADLVDVGGESTRPGARRVPADEEVDRVVPVIAALTADGIRCSVDTTRAEVAAAALDAGAVLVNDVSGGLADDRMLPLVAARRTPVVLMHWRGHSDRMAEHAHYDDVVADVRAEVLARVRAAVGAGVHPGAVVIDPGLGFAKTADHNWALLAARQDLVSTGVPVLIGASRKRFLGDLLADRGVPRPASEREAATAAVSLLAAQAGCWAVRVHEPRPTRDVLAVAARLAPVGSEGRPVAETPFVTLAGTSVGG